MAETGDSSVSPPVAGERDFETLDTPAPARRTADPLRIRRNTACVRCRDAKVKCNTGLAPNRPCQRCTKLELQCVVDRSHKRTTRRSKLEELAAELQTIKEAVAPRASLLVPTDGPPAHPHQLPAAVSSVPAVQVVPAHNLDGLAAPLTTSSFLPSPPSLFGNSRSYTAVSDQPAPAPARLDDAIPDADGLSRRRAEPRALGSRVFSGEDIEYYFDKYFEHFHPYFPIVRARDPDTCYKRGAVLFWTVIMTACRRFSRDDNAFQFLKDSLMPEIWSSVSQLPLNLSIVNALMLVAAWPAPSVRFLNDPSLIFAGIATNSAFLTGLHTGRGCHSEFSRNDQFGWSDATDEEATFTWAGCAIISSLVSAYMGCPPSSTLFNKAIERMLDGTSPFPLPRYFVVHLETSRFADRVSRTMCASLEEGQGVSHHLVAHMEQEYSRIQGLLYPDNCDLDNFTLVSSLLEIQTYYFMPLPGYSPDILKRNLIKCYTTAESVIQQAAQLHRETAFLHYAPHFVFRTIATAMCVIITVHMSAFTKGFQVDSVDTLVKEALRLTRACSIEENDLHMRSASMLEKYWALRHHIPRPDLTDPGISIYTHRLGASLAFACLRYWKEQIEHARDTSNSNPPLQEPFDDQSTPRPGPNAELGLADFHRIDWNAFNAFEVDYDWSFTSNYLGI
ncbi:hypothetical protein B0T26DRAFT_704127 [Lasiosphaeria miniovina]|uniref:Zn(2)-C6 fungal-type domain-containing protein n=1 Tax=Lasiosphaeria miniovina TaxID=1954250 RepID=A0AA40DZZ2_9PEZI|nr:uncharacterized protein B0T26DRAFT_704127 [Lasiosphaeria miniovina]KAK0722809.1 hypothetical protein B0T26DRAFT_704127 [Lasiosphaeria miniovina]